MSESSFGLVSITVLLILFIYGIGGAFFEHKHFHLIHETGLGIILGIIAGGVFYAIYSDELYYLYQFNGSFFFYILLPIIIFSGGYNLNKRLFFQNFFYINLFGLIGTVVSFVIIFSLTYLINENDLIHIWGEDRVAKLGTKEMMIFSATICATDSVAALTMIKADKYPKLFSVVFGEGMVNDAVAIIIFVSIELLSEKLQEGHFDFMLTLELVWLLVKEFLFSIVIGIFFGLFTSWLFKQFRFLTHSCILEISIILYMGYASFTLCEIFELSGVLSVLISGVIMAHYNFYNLSPIGKISSQITFQTLSQICEAFIYIYLGISIWIVSGDGIYGDKHPQRVNTSWTFVFLELAICFFARGAGMFILTMLSQLFMGRDKFKLTFWELNIVWFAGLIRGSIAFALIQKLKPKDEDNILDVQNVEIIQTTVLFMVILTTIILGGLMPGYIAINLKWKEYYESRRRVQDGINKSDAEGGGEQIRFTLLSGKIQGGKGEDKRETKKKTKFQLWFAKFDESFIKPFFIHDYAIRKEEIRQQKKKYKKSITPSQPSHSGNQLKSSEVGIRQKSIAIGNVIGGHGMENQSFRKSGEQSMKVAFRTTLNSKYMGNQEVTLVLDVEERNDEYQDDLSSSIQSNISGQELGVDKRVIQEADENAEEDRK